MFVILIRDPPAGKSAENNSGLHRAGQTPGMQGLRRKRVSCRGTRLGDASTGAHAADFVQLGAQAMTQRALRTQLIEQVLGLDERVARDIPLKQLPPAPRHFLFGEQDRAFRQEDRRLSAFASLDRPAKSILNLIAVYLRCSTAARRNRQGKLPRADPAPRRPRGYVQAAISGVFQAYFTSACWPNRYRGWCTAREAEPPDARTRALDRCARLLRPGPRPSGEFALRYATS